MRTNRKLFLFGVICLLILGSVFIGCNIDTNTTTTSDGSKIPDNVTQLTANSYSDGTVIAEGEQWFEFTATANTQYLWVIYGTMTDMNVQLYDSAGDALGDALRLSGSSNNVKLTVASGKSYYVKVIPGTAWSGSHTGTFRMTFNTVPFAPGTFDKAVTLNSGVWASGNILNDGEQWFKFTASASTHYVHAIFGTMVNMNVQLHTDTASALGNAINLRSGGSNSVSLIVTSGQTYYIRITEGSYWTGSNNGTYQIAFNTSETAPAN